MFLYVLIQLNSVCTYIHLPLPAKGVKERGHLGKSRGNCPQMQERGVLNVMAVPGGATVVGGQTHVHVCRGD